MDEPVRVLHVDEDPDFVDLTATLLEREDDRFVVETAANADEALDRLTDDVDCTVSDYDVPGVNGIEFLETDRERISESAHSTVEGRKGFGLAIVKRIVEAHGWELRVTESESGGARFEATGLSFVDG